MGFWQNRNEARSARISSRIESRGEERGERRSARVDKSQAARIERASRGYSGRPLRTRTWVRWR
jgi:hypothetical protein